MSDELVEGEYSTVVHMESRGSCHFLWYTPTSVSRSWSCVANMKLDTVYLGDCADILDGLEDNTVDLIFTSPPYADNRRKSPYKGVPIDKYVDWFTPISEKLKRVLKPEGSFVLNIKERALQGERHTYVLELILELRKQGWFWIEEYIWHKKNSFPGKWPNRFRDAWERCLHFTKEKKFKMYQDNVMVPMGSWAKNRLDNLGQNDKVRYESKSASGLGRNVSNWVGREKAYPTNVLSIREESALLEEELSNVLSLPTTCSNRGHSAAFPQELPLWFIKLFTAPGDVVLDPFIGSGTTALACLKTERHFVGIEIEKAYYELAKRMIEKETRVMPGIPYPSPMTHSNGTG